MKRPHIVLDTNVLISAILFGGDPQKILEMVIAGSVECALSLVILDELRDVLQRPKFGFSSKQALAIVEELCGLCEIVRPSVKISVVKADPDDDRVIECALEAKATLIVSGDAHLLDLDRFKGIRIVSPSGFLALVGKTKPITRGRGRLPGR